MSKINLAQQRQIFDILKNKQLSEFQLQQLYGIFKDFDFFKVLIKNKLQKCVFQILKKIKLKFFQRNKAVFYVNSTSDQFFGILQGSVYVIVKNKVQVEPQKIIRKFYKHRKMFNAEDKFLHKIVAILKAGDIFGEYGLMNDKPRMATIITREDCYFFTVKKEDFQAVLQKPLTKLFSQKIIYFKEILKKYCLKDEIERIIPYFKEKTIDKEKILFKEGEKFEEVIIIFQGEVLLKKFCNQIFNNNKQNLQTLQYNDNQLSSQYINRTTIDNSILYLGQNKLIGIKEFVEKQEKIFFSVKVIKDLKYFSITKENLVKCLQQYAGFNQFFTQTWYVQYKQICKNFRRSQTFRSQTQNYDLNIQNKQPLNFKNKPNNFIFKNYKVFKKLFNKKQKIKQKQQRNYFELNDQYKENQKIDVTFNYQKILNQQKLLNETNKFVQKKDKIYHVNRRPTLSLVIKKKLKVFSQQPSKKIYDLNCITSRKSSINCFKQLILKSHRLNKKTQFNNFYLSVESKKQKNQNINNLKKMQKM